MYAVKHVWTQFYISWDSKEIQIKQKAVTYKQVYSFMVWKERKFKL